MSEHSFTVTEIAEYFRVSRTAVHDWIKKGELDAETVSPVSKRKVITEAALRRFAENRRLDISELLNREEIGRGTPCAAVA